MRHFPRGRAGFARLTLSGNRTKVRDFPPGNFPFGRPRRGDFWASGKYLFLVQKIRAFITRSGGESIYFSRAETARSPRSHGHVRPEFGARITDDP